jgi:hypothetical protein
MLLPQAITGPVVAAKRTFGSSVEPAIDCTDAPRHPGRAALVGVHVAPPSVERWWPSAPQVSTIVPVLPAWAVTAQTRRLKLDGSGTT